MYDDAAIALAALWAAAIFAVIVIVIRELRRPTMAPLPDPAFRGDRPSVADLELSLEHDALLVDVEIAWLDSIYEMPTREPLA